MMADPGDENEAHRLKDLVQAHWANSRRSVEVVVADSKYGTTALLSISIEINSGISFFRLVPIPMCSQKWWSKKSSSYTPKVVNFRFNRTAVKTVDLMALWEYAK